MVQGTGRPRSWETRQRRGRLSTAGPPPPEGPKAFTLTLGTPSWSPRCNPPQICNRGYSGGSSGRGQGRREQRSSFGCVLSRPTGRSRGAVWGRQVALRPRPAGRLCFWDVAASRHVNLPAGKPRELSGIPVQRGPHGNLESPGGLFCPRLVCHPLGSVPTGAHQPRPSPNSPEKTPSTAATSRPPDARHVRRAGAIPK